MKYPMFAVRDIKASNFGFPFSSVNDDTAIRSFGYEVNTVHPDNLLNKAPGDFELYRVGFFETDTGVFEPCLPELLTRGSDVVSRETVKEV